MTARALQSAALCTRTTTGQQRSTRRDGETPASILKRSLKPRTARRSESSVLVGSPPDELARRSGPGCDAPGLTPEPPRPESLPRRAPEGNARDVLVSCAG